MRITFRIVIGGLAVLGVVGILVIGLYILAFVASFNLEAPGRDEGWDREEQQTQLAPQWTLGGSHIVFGSWTRTYTVNSDGSDLQVVGGDGYEAEWVHSPSLSPDGESVVFIASAPSGEWSRGEVVSSQLDGSDWRRLTKDSSFDNFPVWAPDGSRIAFVPDYKVFTMAPDGSDVRSIARRISVQWGNSPVWAPNGRSLAIIRNNQSPGAPTGLYVVSEDGSGQRKIGQIFNTALPVWSQDGTWLIFPGPYEESSELAAFQAMATDMSASSTIFVYPRSYDIRGASWSADGSSVLMGSTIVETDGSAARNVPGPRGHSSWSPDGSRIAVHVPILKHGVSTFGYGGPAVLYTMASDGSDIRVLVEMDADGNLLPGNGRPLNYRPSQSEQRHQCLQFAEPGVLKYCDEE